MATDHRQTYERFFANMQKLNELAPKTSRGFMRLHDAACDPDGQDSKVRELIALGIAIVLRCDECIVAHIHDALECGATEQEILGALEVAILMGGGPAAAGATHALEALEQFRSPTTPAATV